MAALNDLERKVTGEIARRRDELVSLCSQLVAFDTTARHWSDETGQEALLQEFAAERMSAAGGRTEMWVPRPDVVAGSRQVPDGFTFGNRPQMVSRFGAGAGPSLLLNGHVDVVPSEPRSAWASDPFAAEVRNGLLYGRGTCDMKGGVACLLFAAELLAVLGIELAGELVVCTVTDEEDTGAGGIAAVAQGVRADAGIIPEPTSFDIWVACRGDVVPTITVPGRLGHAGIEHAHWQDGGAVNAIEKAQVVLAALRELHDTWQRRADHRHPFLSPGHVIPTVIRGGDWHVNVPASCDVTMHVAYLPVHADDEGWGTRIEQEILECVRAAAAGDDWLAEHPPTIRWSVDIPAGEVPVDAPIVELVRRAGRDVDAIGQLGGLDSWHDGVTFTLAGTPTVAYGPRSIDMAHKVDEFVPVDDLVCCAQTLAVAAMRHCGVAD